MIQHSNPRSLTFLLLIYRRNQMSLIYSHSNTHPIQTQLAQLFQTASQQSGEFQVGSSHPMEGMGRAEAEAVLARLIEKAKSTAERKNWKQDETNYLLFVVEKYALVHACAIEQLTLADWIAVAQLVPTRDAAACRFRFLSLTPANISHVPWSEIERELLLSIMEKHSDGSPNWKTISEQLYEVNPEKIFRTGKQCREHYTCFLKPNLKKGAWTDEEDYQLSTLFLKLGKKWSKMTKIISGRNQNAIKNRFFLMFENKKEIRLTNSDLVKMVRRRKDKLERKLALANSDAVLNCQTASHTSLQFRQNPTTTNTDCSNEQPISSRQPHQISQKLHLVSEIFLSEPCREPMLQMMEAGNEEFEQYICF